MQKFTSLTEIRDKIDTLDRKMLELLAARWALAMVAVPFKEKEIHFKDDERRHVLLKERKHWAKDLGLPPDAIVAAYDQMIDLIEADQGRVSQNDSSMG